MTKEDWSFPAQDALQRRSRQLDATTDPRPLPVPVDPLAGDGNAPAEDVVDTTKDTLGSSTAAESIIYPRDDLPPPVFTADGAESEVDSPPAPTPLAAEFVSLPYKFSECEKYELMGDRCIRSETSYAASPRRASRALAASEPGSEDGDA